MQTVRGWFRRSFTPNHRPTFARWEVALLACILAGAALLRLGWPGTGSFAFDEARLSLISLRMLRDGTLARLGMPSSTGIPNLPAAAWVFALPYALSHDPLVATAFVGVLSLGAVLGVWALARAAWGPAAGLLAAAYLAATPYSVLYARNIWAQNLLPPLAVMWLATALAAATAPVSTESNRGRWRNRSIGAHVFLSGISFQVHFAGAALVLGTLAVIVRFRWWRNWRAVLIGGGLAALPLILPVYHIACCAPEVVDQYRAIAEQPATLDRVSLEQTFHMALGREWAFLALGARDDISTAPLTDGIAVLAAGLLLVGGIALLRLIGRRAPQSPVEAPHPTPSSARVLAELTLILLVVAPLLFVRHSTAVNPHYMLTSLPALALIAGGAASLLRRPAWRGGVLLLGLIGAGLWAVQVGRTLDRVGTVETPGGLGTPLAVSRDVARAVPDDAPVLFFTHGDDPDLDGEPAVFRVLWWDRAHRIVQGESVLILPPDPAYLLATVPPFQAWEEIVDSGLDRAVETLPRRAGALPFVMTRYDGTRDPAGFTLLDEPVRLAHGAQLEGWRVRRVGPRMRISTLWRMLTPPPDPGTDGAYRQFHHLRTADTLDASTPPPIAADVPLSTHNWQAGDRVIVMGDFFPDAPGTFWVDVGHYTLPDVQRIPISPDDQARADYDDLVRLGPFTWE